MGKKKIVVPCLDVITIAFFPRNIHWSSLFARKARVNTERVPPGHPIILLKSNTFNMAAVLVKRSIPVAFLAGEISRRVLYYFGGLSHPGHNNPGSYAGYNSGWEEIVHLLWFESYFINSTCFLLTKLRRLRAKTKILFSLKIKHPINWFGGPEGVPTPF